MVDFDREALVTTEWLAAHRGDPDLRVVDATYYLPHEDLDPRVEFENQHIPGAVFFDIDAIADRSNPLPHMLPDPVIFSSRVRKLGLGDGIRFVIYDQRGIFSAPRVWWTFRHFGHTDVAVLDGGLPKWLDEGREIAEGPGNAGERHFTPRLDSRLVRDREQILANLVNAREQVVDARAKGRFEGTEPEPRAELRGGHIPASHSLPFTDLLNRERQTLKPVEELRAHFEAAGVNLGQAIVTTCGSGITAAVLALALHRIGHKDVALYDGSWAEWGQAGDTPVNTGPTD